MFEGPEMEEQAVPVNKTKRDNYYQVQLYSKPLFGFQ